MRWCVKAGYHADVTQRWKGVVRHDLFHLIDIIALPPMIPIVMGIQATTKEKRTHHITQMMQNPMLPNLLGRGMYIQLWAWAKADKGFSCEVWNAWMNEGKVSFTKTETIHLLK
jgi:hypothetical protein